MEEIDIAPFQKDYIKQWVEEILEDFVWVFDFSKEEEKLAKQILMKYQDWWIEYMWQ